MKAVVDSNVLVSSFLFSSSIPGLIRLAFEQQRFTPVVSLQLLAEYQRVLAYPRIAKIHGMSEEEIADVVAGIKEEAYLVELGEIPNVIPEDPDDNVVVATAVSGEAEYIVSGDDDLRRLGEYQGIYILSPAMFAAILEEQENDVPQ